MIDAVSRLTRFALWVGMLWFISMLANPASCQETVPISFALPASTVTLHEPVRLKFSIRNDLGEKIHFDLGFDREENFSFAILQPDGSTTQVPPYRRGGIGEGGQLSLEPGEMYTQFLLLNELYEFKKPGRYTLAAKLTGSIQTASGKVLAAGLVQKMSLEILPRDPQRLAAVCQSLADTAVNASSYEAARDAAFALSFVEDPVAVPYLGQVLARGGLARDVVIPGLVRVGSPEAVTVLTSQLGTSDSVLKLHIEQALEEIKTGMHPKIFD